MYDAEFIETRNANISRRLKDPQFRSISAEWFAESVKHKYSYQFDWMGVPIIQYPEDLMAFQELVWSTKPDVIVECGVARGGSLLFWCSMLDIAGKTPKVVGVDILIQEHTRRAISDSKYSSQIHLVEGDSTSLESLRQVRQLIKNSERVMVVLDSNHTEEHVLRELQAYSSLVSVGCYLIVMDTVIEFLERDPERPWGPGQNPWTAVRAFMAGQSEFENDLALESKLTQSVAPNGYWRRNSQDSRE